MTPGRAASGEAVTVVGDGFCPSSRCGAASLRLDDELLTGETDVDATGRLRHTFRVTLPTGRYALTASQGSTRAVAYLLVTVNERRSGAPDAGSPQPPPGATRTVAPLAPEEALRGTPDGEGSPVRIPAASSTGRPATTPPPPSDARAEPTAVDPAARWGRGVLAVVLGTALVLAAVGALRAARGRRGHHRTP